MPIAIPYHVSRRSLWHFPGRTTVQCADISLRGPIALLDELNGLKVRVGCYYSNTFWFPFSALGPMRAIRGCPDDSKQFVARLNSTSNIFLHGKMVVGVSLVSCTAITVPGLVEIAQLEWLNATQVVIRDIARQAVIFDLVTNSIVKNLSSTALIQWVQVDIERKFLYSLSINGMISVFKSEGSYYTRSYNVSEWDVIPEGPWTVSSALDISDDRYFALWVSSLSNLIYFDFKTGKSRILVAEVQVDFLSLSPDKKHIAYISRDDESELVITGIPLEGIMRPVYQKTILPRQVMALQFSFNDEVTVIFNDGDLSTYRF